MNTNPSQIARLDEAPDFTVEDILNMDELSDWVVFKIDRINSGNRRQLTELAQVKASGDAQAMMMVAENQPAETDGKRLCALLVDDVQGQTVRLRYLASLDD